MSEPRYQNADPGAVLLHRHWLWIRYALAFHSSLQIFHVCNLANPCQKIYVISRASKLELIEAHCTRFEVSRQLRFFFITPKNMKHGEGIQGTKNPLVTCCAITFKMSSFSASWVRQYISKRIGARMAGEIVGAGS
jgi:hypothetical protein